MLKFSTRRKLIKARRSKRLSHKHRMESVYIVKYLRNTKHSPEMIINNVRFFLKHYGK